MLKEDMGEERYLEIINKADENRKWIDDHYNELAQKYSNEYICVDDKEIISHSPDIENIKERIKDKPDVVCMYITPPGKAMLL